MKILIAAVCCLLTMVFLVPIAEGHFKLVEPASWIIDNSVGNPQKAGPCGGNEGDAGVTPSNAITKVVGGGALHIKVQEMVFHPGHYVSRWL